MTTRWPPRFRSNNRQAQSTTAVQPKILVRIADASTVKSRSGFRSPVPAATMHNSKPPNTATKPSNAASAASGCVTSATAQLYAAGSAAAEERLGEGATLIYLAMDGRFCGIVALSDLVRENAAATVAELNELGIRCVLLTGDNPAAARHISEQVGICDYRAACLPENKLEWIDETQRNGEPVCMVGDGVNDAPALKRARVGIAMGGIGSDIAIEAADITLVKDDIGQLPFLFRLARRMMRTIRINLTFSMVLNFAAVVLAWLGILNPVVGALVHNAGSVLVIVNSALLLSWRGGCGRGSGRLTP